MNDAERPDPSPSEVAEAWLTAMRALRSDPPDDATVNGAWWAVELMFAWERGSPDRAWPVILELVAHSNDNRDLGVVAAGPMEDVLAFNGPAVIDRVEERAREDRRFQLMLSGVWRFQIAPDIWERVQTLVDPANHIDHPTARRP